MIVSHSHKFVFVHIPKTAGTSLAAVLEPYAHVPRDGRMRRLMRKAGVRQDPFKAHFRSHDFASHVLAAFGRDVLKGYTVFSVVRNPFDHAVSHFTYLQEFPAPRVAEYFGKLDFSGYLDFRFNPRRHQRMPPFAKFRDQTEFLYDARGKSLANRILNFENLGEDTADLLRDLNIPNVELPRKRITAKRRKSIRHYFHSQDQIDAVRRLCKRDFENFGYSVELPD